MQMSLKDTLKRARLEFDTRLAEVLIGRLDLPYHEIEREFGISETVICRVRKQFSIGERKRGPKPGQLKKTQKQAA
jgi:uncharacterized protein YerC